MASEKRISFSASEIQHLAEGSDHISPQDFDHFFPMIVNLQYGIGNVVIKRFRKAQYQPVESLKASSRKLKKSHIIKNVSAQVSATSQTQVFKVDSVESHAHEADHITSEMFNDKEMITISTYYDSIGNLTEVAFIGCLLPVPNEVLQALHDCLPFHTHLTRVTWNKTRLTSSTLVEIAKMLEGSELTDVNLDNTFVPQANYYVLLNQFTKLKYLSLSNCRINDAVCEMIAERIQRHHPAAESLLALNLSSNNITDVGAQALGHSLRTNRRLLSLSLCNNSITSVGAAHILLPLEKFPLNSEEKREMQLAKCKLFNQIKCLHDVTNVYEKNRNVATETTKLNKSKKKSKVTISNLEVVGSGNDVFTSTNTEDKKGFWVSSGNFTLCSLNLAYNQLDMTAISRIADVVSYQYREDKGLKTGLLRVVIEGNPLPGSCVEYVLINKYIELMVRKPASTPPHSHTTVKKHSKQDQKTK